jgi:hypothetical protein
MLAFLVTLAICFGCADERAEAWIGRNLDDLIRAWGPPTAQATLTDGTKVVEWSIDRTVKEPYRHSDGAGGSYSGNIRHHCSVRMEVNRENIITSAKVDGNLAGCNALFRNKDAPEDA